MTDQASSYIDYQQMEDGSRRWLWCVIYQDRLWRAGVEHQYEQARERTIRSWTDLRHHVGHAAADQLRTAAELYQLAGLEPADGAPTTTPPAA